MSDTTQQTVEQTPNTEANELATLRRVNAELTTKNAARKAKLSELETKTAELVTKLKLAEDAVQEATVGIPLRHMAESISTVPTMFMEAFNKSFKLESKDGKLTLLTADGKPVSDKKGQAVPFSRDALARFYWKRNLTATGLS